VRPDIVQGQGETDQSSTGIRSRKRAPIGSGKQQTPHRGQRLRLQPTSSPSGQSGQLRLSSALFSPVEVKAGARLPLIVHLMYSLTGPGPGLMLHEPSVEGTCWRNQPTTTNWKQRRSRPSVNQTKRYLADRTAQIILTPRRKRASMADLSFTRQRLSLSRRTFSSQSEPSSSARRDDPISGSSTHWADEACSIPYYYPTYGFFRRWSCIRLSVDL
jgi:hypothetical protein